MMPSILTREHAKRQPVQATPAWVAAMRQAFTQPQALLDYLQLDASLLPAAHAAAQEFPLRVPRAYAARMRQADPNDPLLLQVLPVAAELQQVPGYVADPVGDMPASRGAGVLHKYHGRALLVTTGACGINCRFCFRRHFPYAEHSSHRSQWDAALALIEADTSIREVILSGGDPLTLSDSKLAALVQRLDAITHLQRLRIHSRQPVVVPERVDAQLLEWLRATRLQTVLVLHCNHAQELGPELTDALKQLRDAGVTLLNQSVLLRGVNDSLSAQCDLAQALFAAGVLPYYLHVLDKVAGAAHFDLPLAQAQQLHRDMAARLPGYLLPRLVRELPGQPNKTLV